jgi:radical SAM protein with 4Fe4S-binding SPASM domain
VRAYLEEPIKATLSVTDRCTLNCAHCYGECSASTVEREMRTEEWKRVIDEAIDSGVVSFLIEGGEPLLRTDILELLQHAQGRAMVWLRTHATTMDGALARDIRAAGVATLCVDIFGGSAATHDDHAGVEGSFNRTLAGIRAARAANLDVLPLLILTRKNRLELQAYIDLAHSLGLKAASILRLYPIGRAAASWSELACSSEEMTEALSGLVAPPGFRIMQSWHPRDANCCWEGAAVMADGRSVGCPYLRSFVNYGNVRDVGFRQTWDDPLYRQLRRGTIDESHCSGCADHEGTAGGCRSTAYAFTGDWNAQDPFCSHANRGVDLRALPEWVVRRSAGSAHQAGP